MATLFPWNLTIQLR